MGKRVWRTANGKEIPVEELSDEHLENAIAWCQRNEGIVRRWGMERYRVPKRKALGAMKVRVGLPIHDEIGVEIVFQGALPLPFVYEPYSWLLHERSRRRRDAAGRT